MRHAGFILTSTAVLAACSSDPLTAPETDGGAGLPAAALAAAKPPPFSALVRIDLAKKTMTVSPAGPDFTVLPSNLQMAKDPSGRRLVLFDVALRNLSTSLEFVAPSNPPPPAGYTGLMLYPYRTATSTGSGGAVESTHWDGTPHNFSGTTPCDRLGRTVCHRWEPYPAPLRPGRTTRPSQVGFLVDPQVKIFEAALVLAADLDGGTGTVQAHVESADLGPLAGVTVTVAGQSAGTNAAGVALVTNVSAGPTSVTLSTLPAGCVNPGPLLTTVIANATAVVKFAVPCTRRILFTSTRDVSNGEIYSMQPDGSGVVRLTFEPAYDAEPSQSPDGNRIAFSSSRDPELGTGVYMMNANGSGVTRLVYGHEPAWYQDGSRIAYTTFGLQWAVYTMSPDGSGQTQRTFPAPTDLDINPAVGPDGSIAFSRITPHPDDYNDYNIWVLSPSGTATQITSGPALDYAPSWSPDGTRIAFTSGPNGGSSGEGGPTDVWVMNRDGSNQIKLTEAAASDYDPTWSPNGAKIAFTSARDGAAEVYVMNADGSNETRITNHPGYDWQASWKP